MWQWLTQTDAGMAARIAAGVSILLILAIVDLIRHRKQAGRWREYLFLLFCVAVAMMYGIINDLITSSISWEYFCFGKGLWPDHVSAIPPEPLELHLAASMVGIKATWTAGLFIGVAILIANNPRPNRPQLGYFRLAQMLPMIFSITVLTAAILGLAGYLGYLAAFSNDFTEMVVHDEMRPFRFMAVFGIHLGGYIGGLIGMTTAICLILIRRKAAAFKTIDTIRPAAA